MATSVCRLYDSLRTLKTDSSVHARIENAVRWVLSANRTVFVLAERANNRLCQYFGIIFPLLVRNQILEPAFPVGKGNIWVHDWGVADCNFSTLQKFLTCWSRLFQIWQSILLKWETLVKLAWDWFNRWIPARIAPGFWVRLMAILMRVRLFIFFKFFKFSHLHRLEKKISFFFRILVQSVLFFKLTKKESIGVETWGFNCTFFPRPNVSCRKMVPWKSVITNFVYLVWFLGQVEQV